MIKTFGLHCYQIGRTTHTILESVVQATETEPLDETQLLQDQSTDVHEVFDTDQTFINKQAVQNQEIEDE